MKSLLRFFGKAQGRLEERAPWFTELYFDLLGYKGNQPFHEVIEPWRPKAEQAIQALEQYQQIHYPPYPYEVKDEDLWRLYALSRLNDYLLFGFQTRPDFYQAPSRQSEDWLSWMKSTGHDRLINQPVYWPGLMFGEMFFSRAGVRVRSSPGVLDKEIAENSRLYFTFWRARRETKDLSHGWGSNSQWRTSFRRDYRGANGFHYNVDGKYLLDETYFDSLPEHDLHLAEDGLSLDERIEALTNRCLVRCQKNDQDRWPFHDRFDEITTSRTT